MADDIKQQQEEINRQINEAYDRLEKLGDDEKVINEELRQLNSLRPRYAILSEVNDQLEKLEKLGGAELFWGEGYDRAEVEKKRARIHDTVINYDARVAELQTRLREDEEAVESLTAKINVLNDDSIGLEARKEAREHEFVITREMVDLPFRPMRMPWNGEDEDQKKFRKILAIVLLCSIILGILIPMWDIPVPDRLQVVEVPERLAKLIQPPPPPPPPPQPKEQQKEEEKKPEKKQEKKEKKPEEVKKARKKAESAGLMAFKDDFADLIDDVPVTSKLGAKAKISGKGSGDSKKTTRSLVTAAAGSGSGGINTASLSRNVGGSGESIGGVEFSRVESSLGTDYAGDERPLSDGPGPSRTDEEIQIVFDKYKAALYRIYNKELRKNPTLQGKMVLRLTIEPDGSVSSCKVDSSDMDSPDLDKMIAERVKRFNFGAKEGVPTITILYPIDFLPAT